MQRNMSSSNHRPSSATKARTRPSRSPTATTTPRRRAGQDAWSEHLRCAVCYWHTFVWPGSDVFGAGTFDRPWAGGDRSTLARAQGSTQRSSSSSKLGVPYYTLPRPRCRPRGRQPGRVPAATCDAWSTCSRRSRRERPASSLLWGTANLFAIRVTCRGRRQQPDPEVFAYAAAQVNSALNATHRAQRRQLRDVGRPRRLRDVAQYRPEARARTARALHAAWWSSTSTRSASRAAADRAEAAGAHQAPVRLRQRHSLRLPQRVRAREGVQGEHRGQPRDPGGPQLPARDRHALAQGHLRQHRRQPRRSA